jgi:hypothetical protein
MRRELINKQKEAEAEVDGKSGIDSIDSLICAWGTHMCMGHRATQATIADAGDDGDDWR